MVLLGRIELPTSALPRMRSTTELQQRTISPGRRSRAAVCPWPAADGQGRAIGGGQENVKPRLPAAAGTPNGPAMADDPPRSSREERLAAQLRENLKRRKAQARALAAMPPDRPDEPDPECAPLSKPRPPG